jgi:ABC-type multidrug transport system ATPase subunit
MRPEASAFPASPLTVWVGSTRYVFAPGRDVLVGYGPGVDVPLSRAGSAPPPPPAPSPDVVLRFAGGHWVAIDRSPHGIFVNGSRAATVDIRSGQAIMIGDPRRGPRLVFQIGPSPGPPRRPSGPTSRPAQVPPLPLQKPPVPTQRDTQQMRIVPAPPPAAPPVPPPAPPVPPSAPPVVTDELPDGRGLIERMTTRELRVREPPVRPQEDTSTHRLPLKPGARTIGVTAYRLGVTVDGREILTEISFTARPATLTAVVGPSAARNAALLGALAGTNAPSFGRTTVDGHDVGAEPESMRARIGIVPRDERVHPRLTVEQAMGFAAELRLPPDTSSEHRQRVVDQVLDELELTTHRATRINKLSPEARRCASLAIELITRPTMLVVDEPGAGLDPAQQDHVMAMLRRQADIGCAVVVAMSSQTSLTNLNMCDQVLVLTSKGAMAFLGPPLQIESSMGTADWSKVLELMSADPDGAHRAYRARQQALSPATPPEVAELGPLPAELTTKRQIRLLARRQVRLLLADHLYSFFLAVLPFVLAALTLLIPGDSGLDRPKPSSSNLHEGIEILAALNIAAVIVGSALTIRAVVEERRVFRREQQIGLSASAYLAAKLIVFGLAAAALTGISFVIVIAVKGGPGHGAVFLHDATVELYVGVAVTAIVAAIIGLALSTLGTRPREVLPLLVPVILAAVLFDGSLVQLVSKWGFQQISWFVPAQWGFAASASTVDLRRVDALAANAEMWTHYSGWWVFDMVMLVLFGAVAAGFVLYRLRPPTRVRFTRTV